MKLDKNAIIKNFNGIFCIICAIALMLPFGSVNASVSVAGISGDASQTFEGITIILGSGIWGYIFIAALAGTLIFSYVSQLSSYKKMISLIGPIVMILCILFAPGNYSAEGGTEGVSSYEVSVSYSIGFWIILICCICMAAVALIGFLGLKGNPLFDAINSEDDEAPKQKEESKADNAPSIKLNAATEKIESITKNISEAISQQAGNLIEKAKGDSSNSQSQKTNNNEYAMEQINKLFEMKEKGILTEEEFTTKKTEYLSKL